MFPANFVWGAATAAYQIEGAPLGERGTSIWDTFSHTPGKIADGSTGDVACDHYSRWRDDIALMRELGLNAYRFSVAWPRILPTGTGRLSESGLAWYERLVDALLEAGIQPWLTLYHWDLPQPLENAGGWPERATADAFAEYAAVLGQRLGDRVKHWITLNEPWCSAYLGYWNGEHAPGERDARRALQASHVLLLAHGKAVEALRAQHAGLSIGITLNSAPVYGATESEADTAAAARQDGFLTRWFADPLYGRGYPADMLALYGEQFATPDDADLRTIAAPTDFLGINYYQPNIVRDAPGRGPIGVEGVGPGADEHVTDMGWRVRPESLTELVARLHAEYPVQSIVITENGAAYATGPSNGRIHDVERTDYVRGHVDALGQALAQGVPVGGYFLWSLMDNFEWGFGFLKRFGIIHVDYATQQRTIKDSGYWYRDHIRTSQKAFPR